MKLIPSGNLKTYVVSRGCHGIDDRYSTRIEIEDVSLDAVERIEKFLISEGYVMKCNDRIDITEE